MPTVREDEHPVGERDRLVDVVRDEQRRGMIAVAQLPQQRVHAEARERVERAERLVEQQQPRLADERAGERDALGLAARQRARPRVGAARDADLVERGERVRPSRPRNPISTLRQTRCHGSRRWSWKATARSGGASRALASGSSPASARSSVLLPEPLAPSSATTSASRSSRSTWSITVRSPKRRP